MARVRTGSDSDRIKSQPDTKETGDKGGEASTLEDEKKQAPQSPRDFIHRRMRELDKQKDREDQN